MRAVPSPTSEEPDASPCDATSGPGPASAPASILAGPASPEADAGTPVPRGARGLLEDLVRRIAAAPGLQALADEPAAEEPAKAAAEAGAEATFVSSVPAGPAAWRLALIVVGISVATFVFAVPYVRVPLAKAPAFIPAYQSALAINDLMTAVLLMGQFRQLRSRALLALASGYLFCALMIVSHTLTFPGLFAPSGLLGAGAQSTAWLYVFWHGTFPLFIIAYAVLNGRDGGRQIAEARVYRTIFAAVAGVAVVVGGFTTLATAGMDLLPVVMQGSDYAMLVTKGVSPAILVLTCVALAVLWRQRRTTVLDLWLMVVMCVWLCDVGLSAVFGSSRFDFGFYAGRSYGLLAASFVLGVLLIEINSLHGRLMAAQAELGRRASALEERVRERTSALSRSNEALKAEVGERRQAEHELISTRAFLNTVIENIPAAVMVKDAKDLRCVYVNGTGERLLQLDRSQVIGRTAEHWMPAEDAALIDVFDRELLTSSRLAPPAIHRLGPASNLRLVRTSKVRILDDSGEPKYLLGFSEDITDQRKLEEQLGHAQKMEALGQLTGGLAHDFNNLLAIIIGNLDVLQETPGRDPAETELVADALGAALRGSDLIRRLLAFARRQPLQPDRIDVNVLIGDISRLLTRSLGETIDIKLALDPSVARVIADPTQLQTAIANLANNARDAMPDGGKLTISTYAAHLDEDYVAQYADLAAGDYVAIEVSDTGAGMSREVMARIFEPFFTTKAHGKGTGLGLSMVFGFLKQSGGHVNVYSEPDRGTTFRLYLKPATADAAAAAQGEPMGSVAQPKLGNRRETVLVVEDNDKLREVVVKQLSEAGYNVAEAHDGRSAIAMLDAGRHIDLVFSDVVMPGGMDGCALARELAGRGGTCKVLLTSGFPGAHLKECKGEMPLLSKPYRKDELLRLVRAVLDGRTEAASA